MRATFEIVHRPVPMKLACALILLASCGGGGSTASITCPPGTVHAGAPYPDAWYEHCYLDGTTQRHGPFRTWSSKGVLLFSGTYDHDVLDGYLIVNREDGGGRSGPMDHGKEIGVWRYWRSGGTTESVTTHDDGNNARTVQFGEDGVTVVATSCTVNGKQLWLASGATDRGCP